MAEETGDGQAVLWCGHCEEPVRREGDGPGAAPASLSKAVHDGTGEEECANGEHIAAPTGTDPELKHIARRAREKYPEYDIGVVHGFLLRAAWRLAAGTPIPVEATTEELLLAGIARQVRMRELDAERAVRGTHVKAAG